MSRVPESSEKKIFALSPLWAEHPECRRSPAIHAQGRAQAGSNNFPVHLSSKSVLFCKSSGAYRVALV